MSDTLFERPDSNGLFPYVQEPSKFLEGVPSFPGPFKGISEAQINEYENNQLRARHNWGTLAENELHEEKAPEGCADYTQIDPMFPQGYKREVAEEFNDPNLTNPRTDTGFGTMVPQFIDNKLYKCHSPTEPLLDVFNRPVDQFSHNNMVPYFGSKITQNMRSTGVPQVGDNNSCTSDGFAGESPWRDKLSTYTGLDEAYMHKREAGPMFSPGEQQTGWVFGSPDFRPELDRYTTSIYSRNNEAPIEKIQVGRGIGLDYDVPAAGGLHQYTRILPNNVGDYKANQLEGRIHAGKWFVNHPTAQYTEGPIMKNPKIEWTMARRPDMQSRFYTDAPSADSDTGMTSFVESTLKGKQSRPDTEAGAGFGTLTESSDGKEEFSTLSDYCVSYGQSPVGMTMKSGVPAESQERTAYNNVRETFKKGDFRRVSGSYEFCGEEPEGSNRYDISMGSAKGPTSAGIPRAGYYVNYTDRGSVNPYVINVVPSTPPAWNPNSYEDTAKTTMKETTSYSYRGGPIGRNRGTQNTWSDAPKVTNKETTYYSHHGAPTGATQAEVSRYTDEQKTTTRETTNYSWRTAPSKNISAMDRFQYEGDTMFNKDLNSGSAAMKSEDVLNGISIAPRQKSNKYLEAFKGAVNEIFYESFGSMEKFGENFQSTEPIKFSPEKFINGSTPPTAPTAAIPAQWSKGGTQQKGLRSATEVWNWFPGMERANLLADADPSLSPLSSIGKMSWNGLNEPSIQGPGTLASANVDATYPVLPSEENMGAVQNNGMRNQYVDYRSTDVALIQSLKRNPLSIYVSKENSEDPLPSFFNFIKPDDYSDYITSETVQISKQDAKDYVNGSPQNTILGLSFQNPMMGITTGIPNTEPKFSGRAYGSDRADTRIYNMDWTNDFGMYIERFHDDCQNRALAFASPGYDVSHQINNNVFVVDGVRDNLPWGPKKVGEGPDTMLTQLGGIWNGQYANNTFNIVDRRRLPRRNNVYDYEQGLPHSLII